MLTLPGASEHPEYPFALAVAGGTASRHGDRELAATRADEALAAEARLATHPDGEIDAWVRGVIRASQAMSVGAWPEAAAAVANATEYLRSAGLVATAAFNLAGAAVLYATAGDAESAIPLATEGLALARQVGMPTIIAMNLAALASALADSEPDQARALLYESIELRDRLRYEATTELAQGVLVAARLRDWPVALDLATHAVPHLHWIGDRPQLAGVLNVVARAVADEDPEAAAVLQGASRRLALAGLSIAASPPPSTPAPRTAGGLGLVGEIRRETAGILDDALGGERRRQLRAVGEAMDQDQAATYALDAIARSRRSAPTRTGAAHRDGDLPHRRP